MIPIKNEGIDDDVALVFPKPLGKAEIARRLEIGRTSVRRILTPVKAR
jgi:hypothetical protein